VSPRREQICVIDAKPRSKWTDVEWAFQAANGTVEHPVVVIANMEYTLPSDCSGLCLKVTDCNVVILLTATGSISIAADRVSWVCIDTDGVIGVSGTVKTLKNGPNVCAHTFEVRVTGEPAAAVSLDCSLTRAAMEPGGCAFGDDKASVSIDAAVFARTAAVTAIGYHVEVLGPLKCQALAMYADDAGILATGSSFIGSATIIATRSAAIAMPNAVFKHACVVRAWDDSRINIGIASRSMLRGSVRGGGAITVEYARINGEPNPFPLNILSP
jgi:hypothetical protein